jgi:predicted O-methyltransferase YrrM
VSRRRAARRRLLFGLQTLLGLKRRGFFIPYRYADGLPEAGSLPAYGALERRFAEAEPEMAARLSSLERYKDDLSAIGENAAPPEPRWGQSWFPGLDAAMAYVMLREEKPARVIEVGSGHSTRFLARARRDGGLATEITAIDPAPRADIARLDISLQRRTLQEVGETPFAALEAGDFLLIDSSHILMPGSDVDFLLGRILPSLPPGLFLAFHDIFLPDDYPAAWAWRGYNEQQGVMGLLQGGYDLLFSSHYARSRLSESLRSSACADLPRPEEALESGLWLRRCVSS